MVKIINLKTSKVITKQPPEPLKCNVCGSNYDERVGGISGNIKYSADVNILDVAFCSICTAGVVQMLIDNQNKGI
tara:strand:+ start:822 stop:1046 length:225 start_codon:yes stop_codon:yes gene_type:complete